MFVPTEVLPKRLSRFMQEKMEVGCASVLLVDDAGNIVGCAVAAVNSSTVDVYDTGLRMVKTVPVKDTTVKAMIDLLVAEKVKTYIG